jgi:Flp pilus assembly pilin Flp
VFKTFISMLINDDGQGLVEYVILIALISIVAMAALRALGGRASNSLTNASNALSPGQVPDDR